MVEAMRAGLLTSVAARLMYAGWECRRGYATSSIIQLTWHSSSFFPQQAAAQLNTMLQKAVPKLLHGKCHPTSI